MKKAVVLVLIVALALSLAACGLIRKSETVQETDTPNAALVTDDNSGTGTENNANQGGEQTQPAAVTPAVVVTAFPAPSNTPAPTPTVAPTPEAASTPAVTPGVKTKTTATEEELKNGKDGYVSGDGVNMRDGIGTSADVITSFPIGTKVLILGTENGWTKVSVNGTIGYIFSKYVAEGTYSGGGGNGGGNVYISDPLPTPGDGNATIIDEGGGVTPPAPSDDSDGGSNAVIIIG